MREASIGLSSNSEEEAFFLSQDESPRTGRHISGGLGLGAVLSLFLVGAALCHTAAKGLYPGGILSRVASTDPNQCHTAVKGDDCYKHVHWAKTVGIAQHDNWYKQCLGITEESSDEEVQACIFKLDGTKCPLPCNITATAHPRNPPLRLSRKPVEEEEEVKDSDHPCHTAKKGDACYSAVAEAMLTGIVDDPDRFPGLTSKSSFEEFQLALHRSPDNNECPRPCQCHTVEQGDECYTHVHWALDSGIGKHPLWYVGLTPSSSVEDVQRYMHKDVEACPLPCSGVTVDEIRREEVAKGGDCNEMAWPDRAGVCGECKVQVRRFDTHYKSCHGYCREILRECKAAYDNAGDGCSELWSLACDETLDSHTAICECGAPLGPSEVPMELDIAAEDQTDVQPIVPPEVRMEREQNSCHTAVEGEECHKNVIWGMTKGIWEHPEWYPGLTQWSTFEDYQELLHKNPTLHCPRPCKCHTAEAGEKCHENIKWVLNDGIVHHPGWYKNLTTHSRWEDIQMRLLEDVGTTCERPCTKKKWGTPSLFCIGVFRSVGYELELVRSQVEKGVGIFSCDEFRVLSDKVLPVTKEVRTLMIPPCEKVGVSKDGTAANSEIFMNAWAVIKEDARYKAHDWVIKADPDAVVLVDRLRAHLEPYTDKSVWIKNCMKYTGPGWPMMFGSLEAFSHEAIETYFQGADKCKTELEWQAWGEDLYMGRCLDLLGSHAEFDGTIIGDNVCKGSDCSDGISAAYHPFKSADKWFECYNQAMGKTDLRVLSDD